MAGELNKDDIRKEVAALLEEKDAKASVEAKITFLETEKSELSQQLEEAQANQESLSSELDKTRSALQEKEDAFKALAEEKEKVDANLAEASKELDEIRAEQTLATRRQALVEANLLFNDEEKLGKQLARVKEMSDETFDSYKEELIDLADMVKANKGENDRDGDDAGNGEDAGTASANNNSQSSEEGEGDEGGEANASEEERQKAIASLQPAEVSDGMAFQKAVAAAAESVSLDENNVDLYSQM